MLSVGTCHCGQLPGGGVLVALSDSWTFPQCGYVDAMFSSCMGWFACNLRMKATIILVIVVHLIGERSWEGHQSNTSQINTYLLCVKYIQRIRCIHFYNCYKCYIVCVMTIVSPGRSFIFLENQNLVMVCEGSAVFPYSKFQYVEK